MQRPPCGSDMVVRRGSNLLTVALVAIALGTGCTTLHVPGFGSAKNRQSSVAKRTSGSQSYRKPAKQKQSWLASWFGPKEPPPPKSVKEWMQRSKQVRVTEP